PTARAPADALRRAGSIVLDDVLSGGFSALGGVGQFTAGWVSIASSTNRQPGYHSEGSTLAFIPTADVFVADGFSIGARATFARVRNEYSNVDGSGNASESDSTTIQRSIEPRVGYAWRLADDLVFWPRVAVGLTSTTSTFATGSVPPPGHTGTEENGF